MRKFETNQQPAVVVCVTNRYFADEKFFFKHMARGLLSMVNDGPNKNSSRFFITFGKMPLLDGKHVVFGFCCHGNETLDLLERCVRVGNTCAPLVPRAFPR